MPLSTFPFVCGRYGRQRRGVNPQYERAQLAPVDLGLLAGWGLEAADCYLPGGLPLRLQVVFEDGIAAGVALVAQLAQQHPGVPDPGRQPLLDEGVKGSERARAG